MKILVCSCDKNNDLWELFYHCMEKYWPDHPEIIYSTETLSNPYYRTIKFNLDLNSWTRRIWNTVKLIDDNYILLMCDDIFIRKKVNSNYIDELELFMKSIDNIAAVNFEKSFDHNDEFINDILSKRSINGLYKTSMMCQLWFKPSLLDVINLDTDPWTFELMNNCKKYEYYSLNDWIIDWGHKYTGDIWAIFRGKWTKEAIEFFESEGIHIDVNRRGVVS